MCRSQKYHVDIKMDGWMLASIIVVIVGVIVVIIGLIILFNQNGKGEPWAWIIIFVGVILLLAAAVLVGL